MLVSTIKRFENDTGIIYCFTRDRCEDLTKKLLEQGIECDFYHAGRKDKERREVQENWMAEKIKIVIATIAFGMGINKRNVRFVIHDQMPSSLSSYI